MDDRGCNDGEETAERGVAAEFGGGLENTVEAPAGDAVDEEADENALEKETRSILHRSTRDKKKAEDVMMDADVHFGDSDEAEQYGSEDAIDTEESWQSPFDAESPGLADGDAEEGDDDDDEGGDGAGLVFDIVRSETFDWDFVEGVVV